jgi:hypothetical protein
MSDAPDETFKWPSAGAELIATLAYPSPGEKVRREAAVLKVIAAEYANRTGSMFVPAEEAARPTARDLRAMIGGTAQLENRLRRRLDVGKVLQLGLLELRTAEPRFRWGSRWSRRATVEALHAKGEIEDVRNFERDCWKPALPVAHYCAAWYAVLIERSRASAAPDIYELIRDPQLLVDVLREGLCLAPEMPKLGVPLEQLIGFAPS